MAETLLFPSLFASTRVQDQPCALNQTDNRGLNLGLSLGSIDYDPWFIKKKLKVSDLGDLSRLLVPKRLTKKHVLPLMHKSLDESVHSSNGGAVTVYDSDMKTKHELVFKYWPSSESYVLQRNWKKDFVNARKLKEGDLIGLYWDARSSAFLFSLLQREVEIDTTLGYWRN
ncbi:PREDICTED: B3 domain-containing protein At2g33720-like [Fragaria vesca subsp. vesca]|uniref:B3 domain-containing protein At2g33720-like n=1 Tax=Fragaria vesca subsp. vesca TaxID=101020 RepID=UPI0002C33C7A|nr:PREDICTED: B3 domain-containing protein At2g33720-like [Fragaria vesca subsp. vesca]